MRGNQVYSSTFVANYILQRSTQLGRTVDALQLMKLVYLAHGWTLGLLGRPLLEDDVEAWQYGPVVRQLYPYVAGSRTAIAGPIGHGFAAELDPEAKSIVDQVVDKYGDKPGVYLSALTHQKGTPWDTAWAAYGKNSVIPQDLIQRHFAHLSKTRPQQSHA